MDGERHASWDQQKEERLKGPPKWLKVGPGFSKIIRGARSSVAALAASLQDAGSVARGPEFCLLYELVESLNYIVHGSVCKEHIDDLSLCVTEQKRHQLCSGRDRHRGAGAGRRAEAGSLAVQKKSFTHKRDFVLQSDHQPTPERNRKRSFAIQPRRDGFGGGGHTQKVARRAKQVHRLCKLHRAVQKLTMTGVHNVESSGRTAQGACAGK